MGCDCPDTVWKAGREVVSGAEGRSFPVRKSAKRLTVQEYIDHLVRRIVTKFHPEQIILFGSQARGDAGPDSDIDLLVVMPVAGSVSETRLEISLALPDLPVPVNVIVTTPENFAWRRDIVGTIEWPATREGKVLYGRP
jgi:predicted nucleotidyltransferase